MLDIENIEGLIYNNPRKYKYCTVQKNNKFFCSFEFDSNDNIYHILDKDNNKASYQYSKSGVIVSENIDYINDELKVSLYKLEEPSNNISIEYIFYTYKNLTRNNGSKIKYIISNTFHNKYLKKYNIGNVNKIYFNSNEYNIKSIHNGFEVYYDLIPVYRELYDDKDRLIETYIVDYNCMTNKFIYQGEKIIKQLIFKNRENFAEINYDYYIKSELLKTEDIKYNNISLQYNYYYDSDGNIINIKNKDFQYKFHYF